MTESESLDKMSEIGKIALENCLESVFAGIRNNPDIFKNTNPCDLFDYIYTLIIFFNREIITHLILSFDLKNKQNKLMSEMFQLIKEKVNSKIKKGIMVN